jgi:FkbM family methyltransferase
VPGAVVVDFVNEAKLVVKPGMPGATSNIYTGLHEFEDMSFVLHLLRQDDLFVDVGANIGSYTVLAGAVIGARCVSIEPVPEAFKLLMQNIIVNDMKDIVTAINKGVGNREGVLRFSSGLDCMNHVISENETGVAIDVKVAPLDNILEGIKPTVIKIDVEGFETNVIQGASYVLSQPSLVAVIMELNGSGSRYGFNEDNLHKTMLDHGFLPAIYDPFKRTLVLSTDRKTKSGNTLYVRNTDIVRERLTTAQFFSVNGLHI